MQMVEMHDMVVHVLRRDHQVADDLRVRRHRIVQRVLDRADRGDAMHQRADAADALRKHPGVAWVAAVQDDLDPAHHRARAGGAGDPAIGISFRLDTQMPFDPGHGIDDDSLWSHGVFPIRLSATPLQQAVERHF